jgi:hypothetical protein
VTSPRPQKAGTHALLAVGRFEDALNLAQTAAEWLRSQIEQDDPAALSITGMLCLRTSVAAAHRQDRALTTALLNDADIVAQRLGRGANYWHTSFGPTNVQLHRIATSLDLGDVQYVVEHGAEVDASGLPACPLENISRLGTAEPTSPSWSTGIRSGPLSRPAQRSWISSLDVAARVRSHSVDASMLCQPLAGKGGATPRSVFGRFSGVKGCYAIAARRPGPALDPGASAAMVGQVWAG